MDRKEAVYAALKYALLTGLAGGSLGALFGMRKNKKTGRRNVAKGALIGASIGSILGGSSGPLFAQVRKYLDGVAFNNKDFENKRRSAGDKVYIGVAGSANGEDESWFADEMRERFGKDVLMLRHIDGDLLRKKYNELAAKKLDVTVVGHSSGGATAGKFLRENPSAKGYLIDPVSWTGRGSSENATVFTADPSTRRGGAFENTIADIGGRWNEDGANSVFYRGGHSNRMRDIIRDFISKGFSWKNKPKKMPPYVTNTFEKDSQSIVGNVDPNASSALVRAGADFWEKHFPPKTLETEKKKQLPYNEDGVANVLVGGANAAGRGFFGISAIPFGSLLNAKNVSLFRNGDYDSIKSKILQELRKNNKVRVVGHSWGGDTVAKLAHLFPDVEFHALDPVSYSMPEKLPGNLTVYQPDPDGKWDGDNFFARLAPVLGHRWNVGGTNVKRKLYQGGHVSGVDEAVDKYIAPKQSLTRNKTGLIDIWKSGLDG